MSLTPKQIRDSIESYLTVLYPHAYDVEITFLVKDEKEDNWKVNIRFQTESSLLGSPIQALLSINSNGEITMFKEGYGWRA
jgi:hypothetical protein